MSRPSDPYQLLGAKGALYLYRVQAIGVPFLLVRFIWTSKENEHPVIAETFYKNTEIETWSNLTD